MGDQAPPQLSLALVNWTADQPASWQYLVERATAAEAAGIDRIVVSDHVVFGEDLDAYGKPEVGGIAGGRQPTGPDGSWLEPMTSLAVIAGATTTIRLATGVLLAALRRPAVLAKTAATLDVLSGGRLDLGVGIGWQREEYAAAGLDFAVRGRLLDHALEVCQLLWTEQRAELHSPELSFAGIHMMPKPVAAGGVPIWVSGTLNRHVVARLARFGAGWIPWGDASADLPSSIAVMRERVAACGRDPGDLGVVGSVVIGNGDGDPEEALAGVPAMVAAGVTDVRLHMSMSAPAAELTDRLAGIVPAFRAAVGREGAS